MHVSHERVIRPRTEWQAMAELPTRHGTFKAHVFRGPRGEEHVALVFGDVTKGEAIPVRVHSECITSEVFGSLKCDCKEQLDAAMAEVAARGHGAILYLRQEGRGIGLTNKIRAYALQQCGHDTVDANRLLGFADDLRSYRPAADMLRALGVRSVALLTNNPAKVEGLEAEGVRVVRRVPVAVPVNEHSRGYLRAKQNRMGHDLPDGMLEESKDEQGEAPKGGAGG